MSNDIDSQTLRELYEAGQSSNDLVRLTGRSSHWVMKRLRDAGTKIRPPATVKGEHQELVRRPKKLVPTPGWEGIKPTDECNQRLRALYEEGWALSELMQLAGLSQRQVTKRLLATGTKIRQQGHIVGKPVSDETRRKLSEAKKGWVPPPITEARRQKLKEARRGKTPALGMRHSEETRRKMSESRKGANNGRWIDGRKKKPYPPEWTKRLRDAIRSSQDYRCAICGQQNRRDLHVHHIDWDKMNCAQNNLVGVCYRCHGMVHRSKTAEGYKEQLRRYVERRDAKLEAPGEKCTNF